MTDEKPHNRVKNYRVPKESAFLQILGIANDAGEIKPNRYSKYRQI